MNTDRQAKIIEKLKKMIGAQTQTQKINFNQ